MAEEIEWREVPPLTGERGERWIGRVRHRLYIITQPTSRHSFQLKGESPTVRNKDFGKHKTLEAAKAKAAWLER